MQSPQRRPWLAWASVSLLGLLCGGLAILQYRWIGEIADAERSRLREELQNHLNSLSRAFNEEISAACNALLPAAEEIEQSGAERAYAARYQQWKQSHEALFQEIGLAVSEAGGVRLLLLNLDSAQFAPASWPAGWAGIEERLGRREGGPGPIFSRHPTLLEVRRFGPPGEPGEPWQRETLLLQLNLDYVRETVLPQFLHRYLGEGGTLDYAAEVVAGGDPSQRLYSSDPNRPHSLDKPDAWVGILETRGINFGGRGRGGPGRGPERGPFPPRFDRHAAPPSPEGAAAPIPEIAQGRWRLLVWHRAGSLDALVAATRRRDLFVSAGILALILATVAVLVRLSRRAHRLAELQMNFVAGVSHELRTPLTVIRTAAFNLRGKVASRPEQVEKYGALIQSESEKLTHLVEQVLRFASSQAGHVIRSREPVAVGPLVEEGLRSIATAPANPGIVIEKRVDASLPMVLADELALRHVLQNLVDNALKYGTNGCNWIGVFVSSIEDSGATSVEIRVADHGPGIPREEQQHIFDPFFRGRRAIQDQIHGTGLGLNLVKKIVEAHGGTIRVESEPARGTQFIVRIPAAPAEYQDEFANSSG
jgi:signal transduction histidine kinase